jgi:hypothetical protein
MKLRGSRVHPHTSTTTRSVGPFEALRLEKNETWRGAFLGRKYPKKAPTSVGVFFFFFQCPLEKSRKNNNKGSAYFFFELAQMYVVFSSFFSPLPPLGSRQAGTQKHHKNIFFKSDLKIAKKSQKR